VKKEVSDNVSKDEVDLIEMGKFYFLNGKYEEAISEFEKALKINPKNEDIYFNMGIVKEANNDRGAARKMYEKTLILQPDHKSAKEHLDKLVGIRKGRK